MNGPPLIERPLVELRRAGKPYTRPVRVTALASLARVQQRYDRRPVSNYRSVRLGDLTPAVERRADGTIVVRAARPLGAYPRSLADRLVHWAETAPDRVLLAWREEAGFVSLTYGDALSRVRAVAQALKMQFTPPEAALRL